MNRWQEPTKSKLCQKDRVFYLGQFHICVGKRNIGSEQEMKD